MKKLIIENIELIRNEKICKSFRDKLLQQDFKFYCYGNREFFFIKPVGIGFLQIEGGIIIHLCFTQGQFLCGNYELKSNLLSVCERLGKYFNVRMLNVIHGIFRYGLNVN